MITFVSDNIFDIIKICLNLSKHIDGNIYAPEDELACQLNPTI